MQTQYFQVKTPRKTHRDGELRSRSVLPIRGLQIGLNFTGNISVEQNRAQIKTGSELAKIGQLLLCLRNLTATDIITSKANFVAVKSDL